ncbi:hypothetical protein KP509_38G061800 [Ceratopteris richardii]|uniref:TORTIFOLIA1/SINE1-2 N-terminal domain-containing protein n=1 Tax=Ceratopteris richardii TaxID=49495 RepID=A0A8T2Q5F9_CERRI|nr:hypothetical protein KP509_38G061800 [Ceratopteris richardii]
MDYENLSRTNSVDMDSFISSPKCITADATSPLAIHVYTELAKLHKHTLIPYLPRIMDSVLASISSSLQLHPACVQVVAALATYTIDSSRDPASNEETFRSLCQPLLSALSSCHPLHLSEGAASCLKGLVESDRWRCAPLDLQEAVCAKGMEALTNKCTHKVSHVELMQSLTKFSSCVVIQGYGAPLLAVGMDMLQTSSDSMMRIAAARLLEGILKVADAELLDLDLSPIVGALQEYQQDEVAGVRTAATDSLKIDNSYMLSENLHVPSMCHESHGNSPASDCLSMVNGFRSWKAPCPSTSFLSMPSSKKSDKCSHRLPLAPLHQSSIINSGHALARKHPASKHSELKENVAPTLHGRGHTSKNESKVVRVPEKVSPLLWPQRAISKKMLEDWSLFDSPHTPIVSFHEEPHERDSSVTTLLEKHFGKQKYFFEEEFDVCLENTAGNKLCSSRKSATCIEEGNSSDMEDNRFLNQEFCRSSSGTLGTDMCRGIEGICSQDEEYSTECRSEITSDQETSPQVLQERHLDFVCCFYTLVCLIAGKRVACLSISRFCSWQ